MKVYKGWTKMKPKRCYQCGIQGEPFEVNEPNKNYVKYQLWGRWYCTECAIKYNKQSQPTGELRDWEIMHNMF